MDRVEAKRRRGAPRWRSLIATVGLTPFLVLPYRWLWLPCALGAMAMVGPRPLRRDLKVDGTLIVGAPLILVIRRGMDPTWWLSWVLILLAVAMVHDRLQNRRWLVRGLLGIAALLLLGRPELPSSPPPCEGHVVCLGDSITSGSGPGADDAFPTWLARKLPGRVDNAGEPNDTAADLLARLEPDVLALRPDLVLVLVGGNDHADGVFRAQFADNLERIVIRLVDAGIAVVLVEVPTGVVVDGYAGVYRRIARRHGAVLVPGTQLRLWLLQELLLRSWRREPLTVDGVHPNALGAEAYARWLEPYLARACRSSRIPTEPGR